MRAAATSGVAGVFVRVLGIVGSGLAKRETPCAAFSPVSPPLRSSCSQMLRILSLPAVDDHQAGNVRHTFPAGNGPVKAIAIKLPPQPKDDTVFLN